jgi:outer membrane murein-binding lipoprotein Lpp
VSADRPHITLGEVIDHPVTRLVIGCLKALLGVIIMLAAFIGTTYVGDIRSTIEKLAAQMGDMDARVDTLEREAAIRAAVYQEDRKKYDAYRASWCKRNPDACKDGAAQVSESSDH